MKRRELEKVVEKHLKHIEKHSGKIPGSFVEEDIHELRVEYKKLRAFIRLVKLDKDAGDLKLPGKLKSLYHAAGKVRDLDLFIKQVLSPAQEDNQALPHYTKHLNHELFAAKVALVSEIEKAGFDKINKSLLDELPSSLKDDTVKKFVHRKVAAIRLILLAVETEKELHTIRKQLKDIIYNIKIFQSDWGIPFPIIAWKSEKQLNDMATRLGDFNDLVLRISLLKTAPGSLPPGELKYVLDKREELQRQEAEYKKALLEQVLQLQLNSNF